MPVTPAVMKISFQVRDGEVEDRPLAEGRLGPQASAVPQHDPLGQSKAYPRPLELIIPMEPMAP